MRGLLNTRNPLIKREKKDSIIHSWALLEIKDERKTFSELVSCLFLFSLSSLINVFSFSFIRAQAFLYKKEENANKTRERMWRWNQTKRKSSFDFIILSLIYAFSLFLFCKGKNMISLTVISLGSLIKREKTLNMRAHNKRKEDRARLTFSISFWAQD